MKYQAVVTIEHKDHKHRSRRTMFFEAPDREEYPNDFEEIVWNLPLPTGYSGYRIVQVLSVEPTNA